MHKQNLWEPLHFISKCLFFVWVWKCPISVLNVDVASVWTLARAELGHDKFPLHLSECGVWSHIRQVTGDPPHYNLWTLNDISPQNAGIFFLILWIYLYQSCFHTTSWNSVLHHSRLVEGWWPSWWLQYPLGSLTLRMSEMFYCRGSPVGCCCAGSGLGWYGQLH